MNRNDSIRIRVRLEPWRRFQPQRTGVLMMCAPQRSDGLLTLGGATLGQLVLDQGRAESLSVIDG